MRAWDRKKSRERIKEAIAAVEKLTAFPAKSLPELDELGLERAALLDATHIYVEFTNAPSLLLDGVPEENDAAHRKFLRFLHLYERVVHFALQQSGIEKVHFQNARLHAVVCEPFGDSKERVAKAVQLADALSKTVAAANQVHHELPDAHVSIGIEDGQALVVANGTKADRELLFLGRPANRAAKLLGPRGTILGEKARIALNVDSPMVDAQVVAACRAIVDLGIDATVLVRKWHEELLKTPMAQFKFHRPPAPLSQIDFEKLSPATSLRGEMVSIFVDIDGFSAFVDTCLGNGKAKEAAQALHVARKTFRDVAKDFDGRKVQYHGDCMHAVLGETANGAVDKGASAVTATLCVGALFDSFEDIRAALPVARGLAIAIGAEAGPVVLTRLGVAGSRDRCAAGRAVLLSETLQRRCKGGEASAGDVLRSWSPATIATALPPGLSPSYRIIAEKLEAEEHPVIAQIGYGSPAFPEVRVPKPYARLP